MEEKGKKLKAGNIVGLGLGAIGSGIFVMMGFGIAYTGRSIVLVCMVGCLYMLLAYLYNVVMSSMFVIKGGDYGQKALLFNPMLTGVSAIMTFISGLSLASYALAIVDYFGAIVPGVLPFTKPLAILIMTLFFAATICGSRFVAVLENVLTVVLLASVAIFVTLGIPKVQPGFFSNADGGFWRDGIGGFMAAISIMGFACMGTTGAPVAMSAVTENPKRNIPLGILLATLIMAVIYGLMGYVAGGVLPYEQIAGANLSATAEAIFPHTLYNLFILGGGVGAICTSVLAAIATLRYPLMQVAQDGWLPKAFTKTTKTGYPWVIQLTFYLVSVVPIALGFSIDALVSFTMIPTMLMNVYLNLACITLPKKYPEQWAKASIKLPKGLYTVICAAGAVCALLVGVTLFLQLDTASMIGIVVVITFMLGFAAFRLKSGAVSEEMLQKNRNAILTAALNDDDQS